MDLFIIGSKSRNNITDNSNRLIKSIAMKIFNHLMKISLKKRLFQAGLACSIFAAGAGVTYGQQIIHWGSEFDTSADISGWGYAGYGNPYTAGSTITFNGNDAPAGGPSTGCMVLTSSFGPGGTDPNLAVQIGLNGFDASAFTAIEMDVKVGTNSALDQYGTAAYFQGAVETGPSYSFQASPGFNLNPVATNNGWQHVVWPASQTGGPPTTTNWNVIQNLLIDPYDGNYLTVGTVVIEVSNVKFTAPSPTYNEFISPT